MSEDPEVPQMSEPAGETPPGESPPDYGAPESAPTEASSSSQGMPGDEPKPTRDTGGVLRRITGSLRRITGSLQEPGQAEAGFERGVEPGEGSEPYPPEKRKSVTGQLGSIITGILRGTSAEERAARAEQAQPRTEVDEFVSDLRQDLATEEASQPPRTGGTGGLIRTITGSLRKVTGSLRTGQLFRRGTTSRLEQSEAKPSPAQPFEGDVEEDILAGRLSTTSIAEPAAWVEPEDFVIELDAGEELPESFEETAGPLEEEPPLPGQPEIEGPISLIESGAIAALDQAEAETRQAESGQDWISEIRQETAGLESGAASGPGAESRQSPTDQLRSFIASIMGRQTEKPAGPVEAGDQAVEMQEETPGDVSDDLVSGRLDRSLGIFAEEEAQQDEFGLPFDQVSEEGVEAPDQPFAAYEETAPPDETFEVPEQRYTSFGMDQGEPYVPFEEPAPEEPAAPHSFSPADEQLIWGAAAAEETEEGRTIRPDEFWDEPPGPTTNRPPVRVSVDDAYAAEFLGGEDVLPELELPGIETRLHQITELKTGKEPFEDIRSIVLEDLPPEELPQPLAAEEGLPGEEQAGVAEVEEAQIVEPAPTWKTRFAALSLVQKILIIEAVVVALVLVVAVPYFALLARRGAVEAENINYLAPRALPAGVPYPTGMLLPGGWYFKLDKSTFVNGEWKPNGGEWLEGTELRRVVALPWNRQTQAVVQTFQPGDEIDLYLSNNRTVRYKVTRTERVPVDEIKVYTDLRPSLAIILYREDSDQRWVVISQR